VAAIGDEDANRKLRALFRSLEVTERAALEEFQKIEAVQQERKKIVDCLIAEKDIHTSELAQLRGSRRTKAVLSGNLNSVSSMLLKEKTLEDEIRSLDERMAEAVRDFENAQQRLEHAEKDLIEARIEKKKVERLRENRENFARNVSSASSEIESDEMSFYRRKKGK
jgi:flagellar biosynthesis chaperone FliJ